ncbi:MAG: PIN domain-containing protein [Microthrixaceae bacterium]
MALTHLLGTSALKRLHHPQVHDHIKELSEVGRLARPTICDLEVGFSARNVPEWDALMGALEIFDLVETTADDLHRALGVQRRLAELSQRGRKIPDLLVAAAAEARNLTALHFDADFDLIASVTGQRCEWVVPAGSID